MRITAITFILSLLAFAANAQYYYKDQVSTKQAMDQFKILKDQKVRSVKITSFESNGQPAQDLQVDQSINSSFTEVTTNTSSSMAGSSQLKTRYDQNGRIIETRDTTDGSSSTSQYLFNSAGRLEKIINLSVSTGQGTEKEEHIWKYNNEGKPHSMLRIKNNIDTLHVNFILDENGNVIEETSIRKGKELTPVYYYYNDRNQLTDVVRYNNKAKRLLPDYVFEYNDRGRLSNMMVVPEGSDDYQRWIYEYDGNGLKLKETVMNKHRQIMGRVEYQYNR